MNTNASNNGCPRCGAPVPADAPRGLCPTCVLAGAATATQSGLPATATGEIPSLARVAGAFPQLEVTELIGRGGMGFVFKARQPHLDRFVALKLLPDKLARDPQFAERFNREGRVLAKLNHPNIVSIFDFGQTADFYYLLMEYVDGVNLRQAMQAGRFSPSEALSIVPKVCEALQYAHEQGVLHRDIKPENILLDAKGRVKIADFGIAKLVDEDPASVALTGTGAALGTPHYMAPEQLEKPSTVDHRADIYSVGVVFYEMLTGELPIGRFAAPSSKTPVNAHVDEVVFRTLEKEPRDRFQTAGEVRTRVEGLAAEADAAAQSPRPVPVEDFVLCHPRLPRIAQWLTVYALVIAPALWLIGLATMDDTPHPNAYAAFIEAVTRLGTFWGELLTTVLLLIGGWKLRALKRSGAKIIRAALWLNLVILSLIIGGLIWIEMLAPDAHLQKPTVGEAVLGVTQFGALIFQVVALVWLRRNRAVLDNVFQTAAHGVGPQGTMVIPPSAVLDQVPQWSLKSVWAAVLTGFGLPVPVMLFFLTYFGGGGVGGWEILVSLPGIAGTILGCMALSDIRAHEGKLRGLPFAVFGALTLPLMGLIAIALALPAYVFVHSSGLKPLFSLLLIFPAGALTFAIWAVYAAARWGSHQPASPRRGVLKWVFLGLMLSAPGFVSLARFSQVQRNPPLSFQTTPITNFATVDFTSTPITNPPFTVDVAYTPFTDTAAVNVDATPWIRFTFTAVELSEVKGVRWLAIDYLDDVHGDAQKSFPCETTIPGFKAETRTSEFLKDDAESPPVRHQRIEYRMPDSSPRDQLERLHETLEKALKQKSFRLELADNQAPLLLFVLPGTEGGSLQARIKVVPPLKNPVGQSAIPSEAAGTQAFAFGPVVERVVIDSTARFPDESARIAATVMIDFDTGSLHAGSKEMWEADTHVQNHWMQTNKIDALAVIPEVSGLVALDMAASPVSNELWEQASSADVVQQIKRTAKRDTFLLSARGPVPATWLFRTREGGTGILQITGFTDNPHGVQIRYKLVQAAPAK